MKVVCDVLVKLGHARSKPLASYSELKLETRRAQRKEGSALVIPQL
jgi:hypothetical protein